LLATYDKPQTIVIVNKTIKIKKKQKDNKNKDKYKLNSHALLQKALGKL